MSPANRFQLLSVDDYLDAELESEVKHEYIGGRVYAVPNAPNVHHTVASAFVGLMYAELRGTPYQVFGSLTKIRLRRPTDTRFYYPDGVVVRESNSHDEVLRCRRDCRRGDLRCHATHR